MASALSSRSRTTRDVPPLLIAALAALALLAALPSALNLPQASPSESLEIAPIPPPDDMPPVPLGNLSSLGLGDGGRRGLEAPADAVDAGGAVNDGRAVKTPGTKRCVGNPPRQTEDLNSPPCVSFYSGDNGGGTYPGVTGEEIRILINVEGNVEDLGSRGRVGTGSGNRPPGAIYDLAEPAEDPENEPYWLEAGRIWQRYFNERFQTYGRFAHFFVSFGSGNGVEQRRADAARDYNAVRPFGLIAQDPRFSASLPYVEVMARKGVMAFGITSQLPESLYRSFSGLLWSYWPSLDRQVDQFIDYVCTKVVPYPTSFAGNDASLDARLHNGQARRLGLIYLDNPLATQPKRFAALAREGIARCGGNFVAEGSYASTGSNCCQPDNDQAATETMALFQREGVSTIIWSQGYSPMHSNAAGRAGYYPEWVSAGGLQQDELVPAKFQDPQVWRHAVVVTPVPLDGPLRSHICYQAIQEVAPGHPYADSAIPCRIYQDLLQLFTGIQAAGPQLTPASVEKGFRAIPNKPSGSPSVPACFYEPGDYTCVKDAIAQYWDSTAESSYSSGRGCYRVPQSGRRFLHGQWIVSDVITERGPEDPCNGYTRGMMFDPSPGPDGPPVQ